MSAQDNYYPNDALAHATLTITTQRKAQTSVIKIAFAIIGILIAVGLGLIVLLVIGIETGPVAFLLGFFAATIPVPIYVILVLWIDRYESEPFWMLATAFFWGALVATFFAFLLNTTGLFVVGTLLGNQTAGETFALVISAPIVEETGKATILFLFFFFMKDEFDGVIDGIVYAALVALGFAMTENVLYYGKAALGGGAQLTTIFVLRGALAPFSHPLFTSMTGIGLGLARQTTKLGVKLVTPILGLMMAIFLAQYLEWLRRNFRRRSLSTHILTYNGSCFFYTSRCDRNCFEPGRQGGSRVSLKRPSARTFHPSGI